MRSRASPAAILLALGAAGTVPVITPAGASATVLALLLAALPMTCVTAVRVPRRIAS